MTKDGGHIFYTCAPLYACQDNGSPTCKFCEGGLALCTICGGAEGTLPSECPGIEMSEYQEDAVWLYKTLDFKNGKWFNPKENANES
jgi:hypothetical protein